MLDHELDVESDLSAFHRVDDWRALSGPRYFALAFRLPAYSGVIAARAYAEQKDNDKQPATTARPAPQRVVSDDAALQELANNGWLERE